MINKPEDSESASHSLMYYKTSTLPLSALLKWQQLMNWEVQRFTNLPSEPCSWILIICSAEDTQVSHKREPVADADSQNLNLSICTSSLQPREWVIISCYHFIFYSYYSSALPLIPNDGFLIGYDVPDFVFRRGWKWENGSAERRVVQMSAEELICGKIHCIWKAMFMLRNVSLCISA